MSIKKIVMGSAFYSIGNMIGAGLNMIYQFVLMLFLTSSDYGIIQPLLQFIGLLLLPLTAYQYALTKHYSSISKIYLEEELIYIFKKMITLGVYIGIAWVLLIPIFKIVFHIDDPIIFLLLLISLLIQIPQTPFISRMQAENKFFAAGIAQIVQGVTRISLGVICVWKIPNLWGAMIGILISNLAFVFGNMFIYRKTIYKKNSANFTFHPFSLRLLFVSLGSVGLFSLLIYSDTVLVRSLLPTESALFASSNLLGKGMIFLTASVSFIILPLMATKVHNMKKALWIGFASLVILSIAYIIFFMIVSPYLAKFLFKNDLSIMVGFQKWMPYYNMAFLPYPIIYYFLNYYLVKESTFYPIILGLGVISLYTGIFNFHENIQEIINVIGVIGYILLFVVITHSIISRDQGLIHSEQVDESAIENLI